MILAQPTQTLDLVALMQQGKVAVINWDAVVIEKSDSSFVRLSEANEEGLVWLPVAASGSSTVVVEIRDKNVFQRSFIGIAFNYLNDSTYEAVYCRPFNFFAADSIRRIHAIQYISHPAFPWKKPCETKNGLFEKPIRNAPDPNNWFTMRMVIRVRTVEAYINQATQPALVVNRLSDWVGNKIGLFVGDGSGGDFRRVTITPAH